MIRSRQLIPLVLALGVLGAAYESFWLNTKGVSGESDCISKGGMWLETPPPYATKCMAVSVYDCTQAGGFAYLPRQRRSDRMLCDFDAGQARDKCNADGGTWTRLGILQNPGCVRTAKDAGKVCRDGNECEFRRCIYSGPTVPINSPGTGACAESDNSFGCYTTIRDGKVMGRICVD